MSPYETIHTEKANFPVHRLCEAFGMARSGYYAWLRATPSERARQNEALLAKIRAIHSEHKGRYGSPRVHRELRVAGVRVALLQKIFPLHEVHAKGGHAKRIGAGGAGTIAGIFG